MHDTQGRDRTPAQWHYADPRGNRFGPYPAAALVRLFQFGHIRLETPVWRDDPAAATPLRDCTDTFEIGPGSRIRLIPPLDPPAAPGQPPQAPEPAGAEASAACPTAAREIGASPASRPQPSPIPAPGVEADRGAASASGVFAATVGGVPGPDRAPAAGSAAPGPRVAPAPTSRRRILAAAIAATLLAVTAVALRFAT